MNFLPIVNHSLAYNRAIDGLRGIAILLVLLFHLFPAQFSFGYVGVDIFFVLSGFLITQIIYTKLKSNKFSFAEFYRNRVRRIFPAMLIVLASTFLIGYLFLFPSELAALGRNIQSSSLFYQNFRLMGEAGYWDEASTLKPLLHFWSLSIEEQFYLFWPILILILYKLRLNLTLSLFITFLALLILPQFVAIDPFYHSLSRFWELCLGGVVFAIIDRHGISNKLYQFRFAVYLLFVAAIGFGYGNNSFNVFKTLFITISAGLMIALLISHKNQKFFSTSFLVFLGLISFPLYLWHYVLIAYAHIFGINVPANGIWLAIISIFLAYLTYIFVEIKARKQTSYMFAFILFMIAVAFWFLGQYASEGLIKRSFIKSDTYSTVRIQKDKNGEMLFRAVMGYDASQEYIKATTSKKSDKFVLILGDSHAYTSYDGLSKELTKRGYETVLMANSSCLPFLNNPLGRSETERIKCHLKSTDIYKFISKLHPQKVIFISRGLKYITRQGFGEIDNEESIANLSFGTPLSNQKYQEKFYENIDDIFSFFGKNNIELYFVLENPELGFSPKECMQRPFGIFTPRKCSISLDSYEKRMRSYNATIYLISKKYQNVHILDPKNSFCDNKECHAIKNGKILYTDDDHLNIEGSIVQARGLIGQMFNDKK
ncbi:MAG: acyltransferase family protein [Sulfurovaceae bacterium]|nr:acyltransferase family protein [Sulfurovaceae bacterium]